MSELRPELSGPGAKAIGPSSPVVQALGWIREFLSAEPHPDIGSDAAKSSGILAGTHLLHLITGCGLLNGQGHHSAAVVLLRPLEDALGAVVEQRTHTGEYHEGSPGQRVSDPVKRR